MLVICCVEEAVHLKTLSAVARFAQMQGCPSCQASQSLVAFLTLIARFSYHAVSVQVVSDYPETASEVASDSAAAQQDAAGLEEASGEAQLYPEDCSGSGVCDESEESAELSDHDRCVQVSSTCCQDASFLSLLPWRHKARGIVLQDLDAGTWPGFWVGRHQREAP